MLLAARALAIVLVTAIGAGGQQITPSGATSETARQLVPDSYGDQPAPKQPIPYSHRVHLAQAGLTCLFCHTNPEPGELMAFPPTSICMTCHVSVGKNEPAIRQLAAFAKSDKEIPWVRVYVVTRGVIWSHRKHLRAGLQCQNCHGQVSQMESMREATSVTAMGVCINCHAQMHAPTVCQTCHVWPTKELLHEK